MKIKEIKSSEIFEWTLKEVLEEINRDRSEEWQNYNRTDWREGWDEWCEGDIYTLMEDI